MYTSKSTPSLIDLCLVALTFQEDVLPHSKIYIALNTLLNDIIDAVDSTSHPSKFTSWSPCISDPRVVVVVTTASETCSSSTSPIYKDVLALLMRPPSIQHVYLDYSVVCLAASSPKERIPCEIMALKAPTPGIAAAIGKHFGWEPMRSSLSSQMQNTAPAAFSRPGDLIRDFWAWAELPYGGSLSHSNSLGSSSIRLPPQLVSTNSEEKNMSLYFSGEEEKEYEADDESLVMIFQWHDHAAANRFKHPLRRSDGPNGEAVRSDLWDEHVAHPVRQFQGLGAKFETYKLELRAVEPRIQPRMRIRSEVGGRERSGSKRLSIFGLGEKVSGIWR